MKNNKNRKSYSKKNRKLNNKSIGKKVKKISNKKSKKIRGGQGEDSELDRGTVLRTAEETRALTKENVWDIEDEKRAKRAKKILEDYRPPKKETIEYNTLRKTVMDNLKRLAIYGTDDELKILMLKALLLNIFTGDGFRLALDSLKENDNYTDVVDLASEAYRLYLEKQTISGKQAIKNIDTQIDDIKANAMLKLEEITNTSNQNELDVFLNSLPEEKKNKLEELLQS